MIKPLYKAVEPFMEVNRGYGYQGIILYDDVSGKLQCHVCGKWFTSVGQHSAQKHKMKADDYKMEFGLTLKTALCSVENSARHRILGLNSYKKNLTKIHRFKFKHRQHGHRKQRQLGIDSMKLKNIHGVCDAQIKARYDVVKSIVGRDPNESDYIKHDKQLYYTGIIGKYGSLNNFRKSINAETRKATDYTRKEDIELVGELRRIAVEKKASPCITDIRWKKFQCRFSHNTFLRHFGSWSNALTMAGLK